MDDNKTNFITPPPGLFPHNPVPAAEPAETHSGTHQFVREEAPPRPTVQPPAFFPAPLGVQPRLASLTLERDDGVRHVITTKAVFGRNPSAMGEWGGAIVIAIDDPAKSVSKTHAGVRVTPTGSTVLDLHSTNGTDVVRLDGSEVALEPGVPVELSPGELILIGSRTFRVIE